MDGGGIKLEAGHSWFGWLSTHLYLDQLGSLGQVCLHIGASVSSLSVILLLLR